MNPKYMKSAMVVALLAMALPASCASIFDIFKPKSSQKDSESKTIVAGLSQDEIEQGLKEALSRIVSEDCGTGEADTGQSSGTDDGYFEKGV